MELSGDVNGSAAMIVVGYLVAGLVQEGILTKASVVRILANAAMGAKNHGGPMGEQMEAIIAELGLVFT